MRKGVYFSKEDANRLLELQQEFVSVYNELRAVTEDTDKARVAELQKRYENVSREMDVLKNRLITFQERIRNIGKVEDKTDLAAFDNDIKVFFDSLNDYYEMRIEEAKKMLRLVDENEDKKFGVIKKLRIMFIKWKIRRLIRYFEKQQSYCDLDTFYGNA